MRSLVFDTSSIISLISANLLNVLFKLKDRFNGEFFIPKSVKLELIDNPLHGKKFAFQALILADALSEGCFKFFKNIDVSQNADELLEISNAIFYLNDKPLKIVDKAEIEGLVLAKSLKAEAYVVDERTLRLLVEDHKNLLRLFERKFKDKIKIDERNLKLFKDKIGDIKIIRSVELITVAYELGLLNDFLQGKEYVSGNFEKKLLDSVLWNLKLRGCAVSSEEIEDIMKLEKFG